MHKDINVNVSGPVQPTSTYKTKVLKGNLPFANQVSEPNMKYVIKHNFDLGGANVIVPENCVLEFDGGSVYNGTLQLNNTTLNLTDDCIKCTIHGTIANNEVTMSSFDVVKNNIIDSSLISSVWDVCFRSGTKFIFEKGTFTLSNSLHLTDLSDYTSIWIDGNSATILSPAIIFGDTGNQTVDSYIFDKGVIIENLNLKGQAENANDFAFRINNCSNVIIRKCFFYNFKVEGLNIHSAGENFLIEDCVFEDPYNKNLEYGGRESKGIQLICYTEDYGDVKWFDTATYEVDAPESGLILKNFRIQNCTFDATRVQLNNVKDGIISNNYWTGRGVRCVNISPKGDNILITNNNVENFTGSTFFNVNLNSNHIIISNNNFINCPGMYYGIHCAQGASDIIISNNIFIGCSKFYNICICNSISAIVENNYIDSTGVAKGGGYHGEIFYGIRDINQTNPLHGSNVTNPVLPPVIIRGNVVKTPDNPIAINATEAENCTALTAELHILDNKVTKLAARADRNSIVKIYENNLSLDASSTKYSYTGNIHSTRYSDGFPKTRLNIVNGQLSSFENLSSILIRDISFSWSANRALVRANTFSWVLFVGDIDIESFEGSLDHIYIENPTTNYSYLCFENKSNSRLSGDNLNCTIVITWKSYKLNTGVTFYINNKNLLYGTTERRELISFSPGQTYYDTNLATLLLHIPSHLLKIECFLSDTNFFGTFAERPNSIRARVGFAYFCTDRHTAEGNTDGIMIYHKGDNVWVDALGRVVS